MKRGITMKIFDISRENSQQRREEEDSFFRESRAEISHANLKVLQRSSLVAAMVFLIYFVLTWFIMNSPLLSITYGIYLPVFWAIYLYSNSLNKQNENESSKIHIMCLVLEVAVLSFVIIISVFPFKDRPAIFFPIFLIMVPVLFVMRFKEIMLLATAAETVFMLLVVLFKNSEMFPYDAFASLTAMVMTYILAWTICDLRLSDNRSKQRFKLLSAIDTLCGIYNKSTCEEMCRFYLKSRSDKEQCALLFVDMDHFKEINDNYGHQKGDMLLSSVGNTLTKLFRSTDIVGRIGGDEFIVLVKHTADKAMILRKCDQVQKFIQDAAERTIGKAVTCSIGAVIAPCEEISYDDLFSRADEMLYEAKRLGRHQSVFYSDVQS